MAFFAAALGALASIGGSMMQNKADKKARRDQMNNTQTALSFLD
jgi:hypothetical protein